MHPALPLGPHRPPFSLVDRVISVAGDTVVAEKRVTAGDPLCGGGGLGGLLLIEALAQAAACLMGTRHGGDRHRGYLVAASGFKFHAIAQPGETVELRARQTAALGVLHRFEVAARVGAREIAAGQMTFAIEPAAAITPPRAT